MHLLRYDVLDKVQDGRVFSQALEEAGRQAIGNEFGAMSEKHMGSSIEDFLKEEGIFEEAQAQAVKEVVASQFAEAIEETGNAPGTE